MTSPHFIIKGAKLRFLIGGGCNINLERAELLIEGKVIAKATGNCSETMSTHEWKIDGNYLAKWAQVRLIDASSDEWGHINFDHFEMWYEPLTGMIIMTLTHVLSRFTANY